MPPPRRGSTAAEPAALYGAADNRGEPPRGALAFYETGGPVDGTWRDWGHVGLALGGGRVVHAWGTVRVDAWPLEALGESNGWTAPRYLGWAPVERVLRGGARRL